MTHSLALKISRSLKIAFYCVCVIKNNGEVHSGPPVCAETNKHTHKKKNMKRTGTDLARQTFDNPDS